MDRQLILNASQSPSGAERDATTAETLQQSSGTFFCRFWYFGSKICSKKVLLRFCVFFPLRVISCLCLGKRRRGKFTRSIALYHTNSWKNEVAVFGEGLDPLYEVGAGTAAAASRGKDGSLNRSTRSGQQRKALNNWTSYSVTTEHTRHVKFLVLGGNEQARRGIINEKTGKQRRTPLSVRVPPSSRAMEEEGLIEPIMANVSLTGSGLQVSSSQQTHCVSVARLPCSVSKDCLFYQCCCGLVQECENEGGSVAVVCDSAARLQLQQQLGWII